MSSPSPSTTAQPASDRWVVFVLIGLAAGLLSGLFGVGGGTVIVPALVAFAGFDRRLAAGVSLLAIVPTSIVGAISYGLAGHVSVLAAAILALGAVIGAQGGTWLVVRLPQQVLRWCFVGFLAVIAVSLALVVPERGGEVVMHPALVAELVGLGLATGVLSGLLGVGGGVVVVPAMVVLLGFPDVLAKGTSLLMMVPTAISGTVGNLRRGNIHLGAGAVIGVSACTTAWLGSVIARALDPVVANALFVAFVVFLIVRTLWEILRARRVQPA